MNHRNDFLKIQFTRKKVSLGLNVFEFNDNGYMVMYSAALNLSSYGESKEQVEEMFKIVIKDFCENLLKLDEEQINKELKNLGWVRNSIFKKQYLNQVYVDKEGILQNFNLSSETIIEEVFIEA